ncbi:Glycosidase [Syntrophus gentianae]|uniref:Glycosidase n=1 Tax=Syntrophus gentianae TaxID=43775 RepID=A0A1H7YD90_9BACT|nr:alpha-amylase family glycosyl hydrolase [Syntrophus gentianae]SEM43258.1 Glycosidase [Syntrophus gentianae]
MILNKEQSWFNNAIMYHILIDRFSGFTPDGALRWDTPDSVGGNINGITAKLDYLSALGVNTLWLSPFYQNAGNKDAYHGYHITDYFSVDSRFGTNDDLGILINECHKRGMRVVGDFVPNHCHENHEFFQSAKHDKNSPYRRWFVFHEGKTREEDTYEQYLNCGFLPKFNFGNPETRNYMIQVALFWLDLGFDGFRIDHAIGVSHSFLKELSGVLKEKKSHCVLFGEALLDTQTFRNYYDTIQIKKKWLRKFFGVNQSALQLDYAGTLNGVLDFEFQSQMVQYVTGKISKQVLEKQLQRHLDKCPKDYSLVLFLDSHDSNRLICENRENLEQKKEILKYTAEVMLEYGQKYKLPVSFYYGFEIMLNQVVPKPSEGYPYADLLARRAMDWTRNKDQEDFLCSISGLIKRKRTEERHE